MGVISQYQFAVQHLITIVGIHNSGVFSVVGYVFISKEYVYSLREKIYALLTLKLYQKLIILFTNGH